MQFLLSPNRKREAVDVSNRLGRVKSLAGVLSHIELNQTDENMFYLQEKKN